MTWPLNSHNCSENYPKKTTKKTNIKICHKCFSTFLIPSSTFLEPSWMSTVTFHLYIFPSTHYRPVQDQYHVSWVCMVGPNCLGVTTLGPRQITYMTSVQCRIMFSMPHQVQYATPSSVCHTKFSMPHQIQYATPSSVCHSDSLFNVG